MSAITTPLEAYAVRSRLTTLFRAIEDGSARICTVGPTWDEVYTGDVRFDVLLGEDFCQLVVFNDCDDVDYLDNIIFPDHAEYDFDDLVASLDLEGFDSRDLACVIRDFNLIDRFKAAESGEWSPSV